MKSEAKVGFFIFLGLIFLFFLTTQVSSLKNFSKEGYYLYSHLNNVAGLDTNSKVRANGIEVGYVESLSIDQNRIKAKLFIYKDIKIPKDSMIKLLQNSMLSGKYVAISLGSSPEIAKDSDNLKSEKRMADFNDASDAMADAASEFKGFLLELREVLNKDSRDSLKNTFANLEEITDELKAFTSFDKLDQMANNFNTMAVDIAHAGKNISQLTSQLSSTANTVNDALPLIMSELESLMGNLNHVSLQLKEKAPALAEKFSKLENDLSIIIKENKKPLNDLLSSSNVFFSSGTDTFEKVDTLLESIDKIRLEVDMRGEIMIEDRYSKGYLSFNYIPTQSKYYRFEVTGMEDYSKMDADGNLIAPKKHEKSKVLVTAQIAKRYSDLVLRAGVIESTIGLGMDYYAFNDKFKIATEAFDINAQNDIRGVNPHAKITARYTFLNHFDLYVGYDNFLNKDANNAFFGAGIHFVDNDLKTLLTSMSLGSFAK